MLPFEFKPKDKGVTFFISIPFTIKEVDFTSASEVNHSQESNDDEEKLRMALKNIVSCVSRKPELSGAIDPGNSAKYKVRIF